MSPSLLAALSEFDGRDMTPLESVRKAHEPTAELVATLVAHMGSAEERIQIAATWLLKGFIRDGLELGDDQVVGLSETLSGIADGHAALHVCQLIGGLEIPESAADAYGAFARRGLDSSATFVRAWATDALHHIALQHPRYADEASAAVARALADPAPSIRARARKIVERA